jgi:CheY-like chemotaxis protein
VRIVDEQPLFCPACGARYTARADQVRQGLLVMCGMCGAVSSAEAATRPEAAPQGDPDAVIEASWPRVIVGHEQPAACRTLASVLRRGGYAPVCVGEGDLVLQACDPSLPSPAAGIVIDVAIPGVLAFEVIEQLRAIRGDERFPIVLLASVFERTRYKRRPNQLYGADAYLELHHVPDRLCEILDAVRAGDEPGEDRNQAPSHRAAAAPLRARIDGVSDEALMAYARRLLSDVALYHGDELARGVRHGQPFAEIGEAIDEARERFLQDTKAATAVFDAELAAFEARLAERGGHRRHG